ncbi:SDR family NAD(P)-dependent oxidoreductase [Mesorhizobium japonicum]|uniref:SDR family NAD(P)-dependent oxidoreductase n=1 Tax=Mesorhizobium japonicum TaxID=2066070 RepID=UPI0009EF6BDD|nr:SDR family NAD(P)-dependent oxidoreductase [Mesorhizobium japonicum]
MASSLDFSGERAIPIAYDASKPANADAVVSAWLARFDHIDHVVPAAAIFESQSFATMTDEQWRRTMSINPGRSFLYLQAFYSSHQAGGNNRYHRFVCCA